MAGINDLITREKQEVNLARVTGIVSSGEFKVSLNGVSRRVVSATNETIKVGNTVLLNKTPQGKYYISGVTKGLGNSSEYKEVVRDG